MRLKSLLMAATLTGVMEARAATLDHMLNPTAKRSAYKILRKKMIGEKVAQCYLYDINNEDPNVLACEEKEKLMGSKFRSSLLDSWRKNTGKFMKELWILLLSVQNNASGVPQQFLDANEEEARNKRRRRIELHKKFRRGEIGMEESWNEKERVDLLSFRSFEYRIT